MNNNTELQDFSLNSNPNTRVSGANTYQFHNYTNTPIVYIGNNPRVAEAVAQSEAERTGSYDPYALASKKAYSAAYSQAPKVGISNGKITVTAPQAVLDSTYYQQLNKELQSLKGADLSSPNVQYAIDKLNEEIQNNFQEAAVKNTIGWALDELNDYQYAMQTVRSTNPMKSSNKIKGRDKDGNVVAKTPKEWSNYWREAYNADDRYQAFKKSSQSSDPYDRTMYLVLSAGGGSPKYGFDIWDRLSQGKDAAINQMAKLPEGTFRSLFGNTDKASLVDSDQKKFNIPVKAFTNNSITNDLQFSQKLQELWGKKWEELSPEDKAFVLILSRTSKEDTDDRDLASKGRIRIEQLEGMYPNTTLQPEIQNMDSSDAVARILFHANFDDYKRIRDSYMTWTDWQEQADADDKRLAENAEWAPLEIGGGNIAGTIGRYLWEAAIVKGLTGGIGGKPELVDGRWVLPGVNVNSISDALGESIVGSLAAKGIAPASKAGQFLLTFAANLAGTIPEDILQTAIDNVLTYNEEENAHLLDPENMSDNLRNNLIVMALFNAGKAGWNTLKRARAAKQLAQQMDLNQVINIEGINADIDDISRAYSKGGKIEIEGETVKAVDGDGNEVVLKNITPEQGEMIQQSYFETGIHDQNKALSEIPSDLQHRWFENGDVDAREQIADILKDNAEIRNASINRLYEDYVYWQNAIGSKPLDFDKWLNTDMAMYRYSTPSLDVGNETLSYSIVPGGLTGFGGEGQIIVIKPKDTLGRPQLAGYPKENEVFVGRDVAENSKPKLGSYENAVLEENILRGKHDGKRAAAMRALTSREIDVWSSKELNDGDRIFTSSKEADELYGHNNVKRHRVKLDEVEWGDTGHGTYNKAKFEIPELETPKAEVETPKAEAETPKAEAETPKADTAKIDYEYAPLTKAMSVDVEPTSPRIKDWHTQTHARIMNDFDTNFINKFHDKFGDVQSSDFDWVWYQSKQGKTPAEIIGTTDPTTNRVITKNMIDAMEWWADQPQTKALRKASRTALGLEGDFNVLGYLPHTDYDPSYASFEEAMSGALWQTSTGASIMDEGKYKGYGGDFRSRYSTFVSNMLWDARTKDVATAKLLDELRMDGQEITPELIQRTRMAVDGERNIQKLVNDSSSVKATVKALESLKDVDEIDWKKIDADTKKQAEDSRLGQAIHDNYNMYYGADSHNVSKQSGVIANNFDTLGNTMRNTVLEGVGSLYDNGGADLVYAPRNAIDIVNRYMREGGDFRQMLQEYVENHSHRSPEYAEEVVDRWMGKIGEIQGPRTKAKVIQTLGNSMKWEAMTRLKRWLALAKYDQFNASTRKTIDRFLFNHMQMNTIQTNPTIRQRLTKGLNDLTSLRYRALFYGNLKNALLQTSELNRYFTSFKFGDVASMAKRLATDETFRARVDDYVQSVAPMTDRLKADIYQAYSNIADSMEVEENGVKFKDLGKKAVETADAIGLGPIEAAENFKNRMMVAALVSEADNLGLSGDEALRHIRNRFERVALAADELGQVGMASNPLARTMLFLQNFQIRELGMHYYNIKDATGMAKTMPKKILAASNYLTKVFGSKLATTLILARLGYSATQTMGIDPFGLLGQYDELNQEDMELPDYLVKYNPLFAGGMTSLIADMYFMARKAYEDSNQETPVEEAEQRRQSSWGLALPDISFDNVMGAASAFIPGSVFANRLNQMNEMMDTGWALSDSGNKMYTAPTDALNTILGYLFGRSATQNAQQYRQTYGDNLWQTLGRFNPFREWGDFDPIDTKNYTDWFKGDENDAQQFNKGIYWFRDQRDQIIDAYEKSIQNSYSSSDVSEAKNLMNERLGELFNQLERFVGAYENKNGTISPTMTKQVVNILNTGRKSIGDTPEEAEQRSLDEYGKALERYSALGLSPVGTYTGPTTSDPDKEVKYQGSPQWRAAVSGYYDANDEAVNVLKEVDKTTLAPIRSELKDAVSDAYSRKDWDALEKIQKQYLQEFDNAVSPVIAAYGNSILKNTDVEEQLTAMLSTGTNSRSANLIPSEQYAKNKYGKYQSMPYESVDVGKWAQKRFSDDTYSQPTITSSSTAAEDLAEIKKLIRRGQNDRARARALQLKVRVDKQQRYLSKEDYKWLTDYLNYKEGK